jgi:hypothetical protein
MVEIIRNGKLKEKSGEERSQHHIMQDAHPRIVKKNSSNPKAANYKHIA